MENKSDKDYLHSPPDNLHHHRGDLISSLRQRNECEIWISERYSQRLGFHVDIPLKKKNRIKYTDEEINTFLDSLDDHDKFSVTLKLLSSTVYAQIGKEEVKSIFRNEKGHNDEIGVFATDLIGFLFEVPLRDVPLYIRSFPDFAKWRLRIGK